jgi:hypothetical protein
MDVFWNRDKETAFIAARMRKGGFGYLTGRRRVGKTALLRRLCEKYGGFYHQAVEGTPEQQLLHLTEEWSSSIPFFKEARPRSWSEFFNLLSGQKLPRLVVFDEFPYWVSADPALASRFQKWIDHDLPRLKTLVLVSGSSQSMLDSQFLSQGAPLYGRALFHLRVEPMSYEWFCRAMGYRAGDPVSFTKFSLVGGVPHYLKLMPKGSVVRQAQELFFSPSAMLAEEPAHWLRDEGITGNVPKAALDLIGRGVRKPGELASRLGIPQGNLSRPLSLLLGLGLAQRELPFGESSRSTKKVLYTLQDPALSFYYGTFLPNRAGWGSLGTSGQRRLLELHASRQWENFCRQAHPGSGRYWEGQIEIDLIKHAAPSGRLMVGECKWSWLGNREEKKLLNYLRDRFWLTKFARRLKKSAKIEFKIFSKRNLTELSRQDKSR